MIIVVDEKTVVFKFGCRLNKIDVLPGPGLRILHSDAGFDKLCRISFIEICCFLFIGFTGYFYYVLLLLVLLVIFITCSYAFWVMKLFFSSSIVE